MKIFSSKLTTCSVSRDGEVVELGLLDRSGNAVSVHLPFEQAESVVMTLPQSLEWALKRRTRSETSRYIFPLGEWSLERPENGDCLLLTLRTVDGFEVTFGVPFNISEFLGTSLRDGTEKAVKQKRPTGGALEDWPLSTKRN